MAFTVWFKIKGEGEEIEVREVEWCGLHPDYITSMVPVYFLRTVYGEQTEIPVRSLAYIRFSKERYQQPAENKE